ncbi:MAG: nitroreductase [Pseudomonadota bacterium]
MADSNDALNLILTRRSIPAPFLADPGPNDEQLRTLLTAAMRVPDHGKLAPWRFVILNRADRQTLAPKLRTMRAAADPSLNEQMLDKADEALLAAPTTAIVISTASEHPKIPLWEQELSVGASTMSLIMATHAMGFAAQWLTGWATTDPAASQLLGAGEGESVRAIVHIGTPTAPPAERPRPSIEDKVTMGLGAVA